MSIHALDLMYALRLEDGSPWGSLATDQQKEDTEQVFAPGVPNLHFITRPRGGSKTTLLTSPRGI